MLYYVKEIAIIRILLTKACSYGILHVYHEGLVAGLFSCFSYITSFSFSTLLSFFCCWSWSSCISSHIKILISSLPWSSYPSRLNACYISLIVSLHLYHERIWFQAQQPYHLYLQVLCQLLTKSNILNTKVWERYSFCWLEFFMCYIARDSGFKGLPLHLLPSMRLHIPSKLRFFMLLTTWRDNLTARLASQDNCFKN